MENNEALIEYLVEKMEFAYSNELRHLRGDEKKRLVEVISGIAPEDFTLEQWNRAVSYVILESPCASAAAAKSRIIGRLR